MVKGFYTIQYWFEKKDILLLKKITYRILLFLIRIIVPLYYMVTSSQKHGINTHNDTKNSPRVIVSITTFPARMGKLWMVLETILRQTQKPDKIILWLASTQFSSIEDVDKRVRAMEKRGIEIRFCDDLRSHKKYYYVMQEFSKDIIITVDDDIFFPENLIENLLSKHSEYPEYIVCYRAHRITYNHGHINKYVKWDILSKNILGPDHLLMATNGAGALYPPNCLCKEAFDIEAIRKLCPTADDIWLKCMGYINGTKTVKVFSYFPEIFTTKGSSKLGLAKSNVIEGNNDIQLKNVMESYKIDFNTPYCLENNDGQHN